VKKVMFLSQVLKTATNRIFPAMLVCALVGLTAGTSVAQCTDMSNSVSGTIKVNGSEVIARLTNNSNRVLWVSYTFKKNGVPSTSMADAGATTIAPGQTVGGEGGGMYSYNADTNPSEIYWYAVSKTEHDQSGCMHTW